jgi:hypothetical protein
LVDNDSQPPDMDKPWLAASPSSDPGPAASGPTPAPPATESDTDRGPWADGAFHLRVLGESSTNPAICPFLRATDDAGLGPPIEATDPRNRCTAIGEPTPQSGRQQELVCLTRSHSNCPRYLRGALVFGEPTVSHRVPKGPSVAILGAALTLAIAASLSVGFLLVRGGFDLALDSPSPDLGVAAAPTPGPTTISLAPGPTPRPTPSPTTVPSLPPQPPSLAPSPVVTPPPTVAPTRTPKPTATPKSNRYDFLTPCSSTPNCWVYTVRPGDNLTSIVNWFGVPYNTVLRMNPQISDPTRITAGTNVRMPPPTR